MIELALPAGTFQNAIAALNSGADAVYFGLKKFSARKGAANLTIAEFSKLRRFSLDNNKKIYITINTLIKDAEIEELNYLLSIIDRIGCDGIIVQDLGVAYLIKQNYPSLSLHGSTQLAIHTIEGVNMAKEIGFDRVVLSRELSLSEIEHIANNVTGIELKVFIHGAMCYGFSGLCSASFIKCGRSGNRGECAQICRTWFTSEDENGFFFSLKDQAVDGKIIDKLKELGISSLKVEGRMKGNEYVSSTASYYRNLIDGFEDRSAKSQSQISFARKAGKGFFDYKSKSSLITSDYASHRGKELGKIISQTKYSITVKAEEEINPYDGLMVLVKGPDSLLTPIKFSAHDIYKSNGEIEVEFSERCNVVGLSLYKISSGNYKIKEVNPASFKLYKRPIDINIKLTQDTLSATSSLSQFSIPFAASESIKESDIKAQMEKVFSQSDESRYTLKNLSFENETTLKAPFFPMQVLKELRRGFYSIIDETPQMVPNLPKIEKFEMNHILPERNLLTSKEGLPFLYEGKEIGNYTYFSFSPISFNEEKQFSEMMENVGTVKGKVAIGLNNIAQLSFAKDHPEFYYFIDIYLYLANRYSATLLKDFFKENLLGGYLWLEIEEKEEEWPFEPTPVKNFLPPLFISRACFRKDSLDFTCENCSKDNVFQVEQNGQKNTVRVLDCITYVLP